MNDCILWDGAVNSSGYPVTWKHGKSVYVHRWVVGARTGDVVMHICDNKQCINPKHLRIGTHKQNSEDMVKKDRQAKGEDAGNSKLSKESVLEIRNYKGSLSSRKVAQLYNISKTNVLDIWNGRIWRHV